uniref:Uncharacterized protein n=1 Tax=Panagrolaimus superbus TaxID=310955 RepID=A0A914XQP8_9BILA
MNEISGSSTSTNTNNNNNNNNNNINNNNNGYDINAIGHHQLPLELPLLQHHGNIINAGGHQNNSFYPTPYYSSDPNTPSTASSGAAYSSLIHGYNPYSAITPQFELIFPGYPWHFAAAAVDIGGEIPLPSIDQHQQTATTAPLFSQSTFSPLHNTGNNNNNNSIAAAATTTAAMTRYSRSSQNPRRGGRRPREEYVS